MILQALNQLYVRLQGDDQERERYGLPTPGYSTQNVTFCIVLNADGSLHGIQDIRDTITTTNKAGKTSSKQRPKQLLVPGDSKPSGQGINPCTLWDNTSYLLGYKTPDRNAAKAEKDAARAQETFAHSRDHHLQLESQIKDEAFSAVCRFMENWTPGKALEHKEKLDDFAATGFGVFRVLPNNEYVHQRPAIQQWWDKQLAAHDSGEVALAPCLVTGEMAPIARLHDPAIKGVNGAAPGGAKLASFNLKAFESYGKEQSYNAPVSERAAFQYCNALNALLSGPQSQRHRITLGDTTLVFWTEQRTVMEDLFGLLMDGTAESAETKLTEDGDMHLQLQALLSKMRKGGGASVSDIEDKPDTRFYLLGLSGNVTRLVIRFWHVSTVQEMIDRLRTHYDALRIDRSFDSDPEFPAVYRLLDQTARERKAIQPLLSGQLLQAVLQGTPYPLTVLHGVLNRLRANEDVSYLKAAIIKAFLIRNYNQTITMSLDTTRQDPAYRLGRLFAALEKTQQDALGNLNSGLRDRFYSSASATPGSVFPIIMSTYPHHLAKLSGGLKTNRERLIGEIFESINNYPKHLTLQEQGLFTIGYYHQRQDFFKKPEKTDTETTTNA